MQTIWIFRNILFLKILFKNYDCWNKCKDNQPWWPGGLIRHFQIQVETEDIYFTVFPYETNNTGNIFYTGVSDLASKVCSLYNVEEKIAKIGQAICAILTWFTTKGYLLWCFYEVFLTELCLYMDAEWHEWLYYINLILKYPRWMNRKPSLRYYALSIVDWPRLKDYPIF